MTLPVVARTVHEWHKFVHLLGSVIDYQWSEFAASSQSEGFLVGAEVVKRDIDVLAKIEMDLEKMNQRDLCTLSPEFVGE